MKEDLTKQLPSIRPKTIIESAPEAGLWFFQYLKNFVLFRFRFFLLCSTIIAPFGSCSPKTLRQSDLESSAIRGVRFDPSYYYNLNTPPLEYLDSLCRLWQTHEINTVYFKAYDPGYGAVYKTSYPYNRMTDYGKSDFMELFLRTAHRYHIQFIAWLPVLEHKGTWENCKEWRIKTQNGSDLMPFPNRYFLCARKPEVQEWWLGFIKDVLTHYPDIDGIDFAEPSIIWKNRMTCACAVCTRDLGAAAASFSSASVDERARTFTDMLARSCKLVRSKHKKSSVTVILTADRKGDLLPLSAQKDITGLDIDRLLDLPMRPDWMSCEVLWQQWADTYNDRLTFGPEWTQRAVKQARFMLAGKAHFIAHVELTPLGSVTVSAAEFYAGISAAGKGGAQSIEFYDSRLVDSMKAWDGITASWPTRADQTAAPDQMPKSSK
jgi:hypothetical protein